MASAYPFVRWRPPIRSYDGVRLSVRTMASAYPFIRWRPPIRSYDGRNQVNTPNKVEYEQKQDARVLLAHPTQTQQAAETL